MYGITEDGKDADGKAFEWIANIGAWILCSKSLDGAKAASRKDIAHVDSAWRNILWRSRSRDWAVLAWGKAVKEGEIIKQMAALRILNEVVIKVVHTARIRSKKNPICR